MTTTEPSHTFQVDLRGMVDLLSHHLYSSPRVFIRELMQNAIDAITARRLLDPAAPAEVTIRAGGALTVTDTGVGLTEDEVSDPERVVEIMLDKLFAGFVVPGATTTVLQDWRKSRHSEVDDLNGHVAAEGARLGVRTPMNSTVVEIAHRIESAELMPDPSHFALLAAAAR